MCCVLARDDAVGLDGDEPGFDCSERVLGGDADLVARTQFVPADLESLTGVGDVRREEPDAVGAREYFRVRDRYEAVWPDCTVGVAAVVVVEGLEQFGVE